MGMGKVVAGAALFAALAGSTSAQANMLVNGGLEVTAQQIANDPSMVFPDGQIHASTTTNSTALNGWTIGGAAIDIVPNTVWQSTEGKYSVDLIGSSGIGSISQTVTGLIPGDLYELSFDFAANPLEGYHGGESGWIKWIDVKSSNTTVPEFYFARVPSGTQTATDMQYIRPAIDFTALGTSTTITFAAVFPNHLPATFPDGTAVLPNTLCSGGVIDNVSLGDITQNGAPLPEAPEPTSLAILGLGSAILLRRRR